jgi:protein O-GlcNAc transferase
MALQFARDPTALGEIRAKLRRNRGTHALFDTARFTRNLEAAYANLYNPVVRS